MMLGSTVSSDWKSSPASGWMSIFAPDSTSLTATGCRLSVGELLGATTSTLSRTNVSRISMSTCSVSPGLTLNGAESVSAKPSRTAWTTYRPGETSGNVTWPTTSLVVLPTTMLPSTFRTSTSTAGIRRPSTAMVTITRAGPDWAGWGDCGAAATRTCIIVNNARNKDVRTQVNERDAGVRRG